MGTAERHPGLALLRRHGWCGTRRSRSRSRPRSSNPARVGPAVQGRGAADRGGGGDQSRYGTAGRRSGSWRGSRRAQCGSSWSTAAIARVAGGLDGSWFCAPRRRHRRDGGSARPRTRTVPCGTWRRCSRSTHRATRRTASTGTTTHGGGLTAMTDPSFLLRRPTAPPPPRSGGRRRDHPAVRSGLVALVGPLRHHRGRRGGRWLASPRSAFAAYPAPTWCSPTRTGRLASRSTRQLRETASVLGDSRLDRRVRVGAAAGPTGDLQKSETLQILPAWTRTAGDAVLEQARDLHRARGAAGPGGEPDEALWLSRRPPPWSLRSPGRRRTLALVAQG